MGKSRPLTLHMQVKNVNAITWSLVGGGFFFGKRVVEILVHIIILKLGFPSL
jgi:hypothetical protein